MSGTCERCGGERRYQAYGDKPDKSYMLATHTAEDCVKELLTQRKAMEINPPKGSRCWRAEVELTKARYALGHAVTRLRTYRSRTSNVDAQWAVALARELEGMGASALDDGACHTCHYVKCVCPR
jgi:ethanolamine ammonia-lyase small subunit